jgi:hypothetical protein
MLWQQGQVVAAGAEESAIESRRCEVLHGFSDEFKHVVNHDEYLLLLGQTVFMPNPPGNNPETHRHYEVTKRRPTLLCCCYITHHPYNGFLYFNGRPWRWGAFLTWCAIPSCLRTSLQVPPTTTTTTTTTDNNQYNRGVSSTNSFVNLFISVSLPHIMQITA